MALEKQSVLTSKSAKNIVANGVNKKIYAFKDDAIGFTEVFNQPNDAIAVRLFTDLTNKDGSHFKKYADQMSLWCIGAYNDQTGEITSTEKKCIIRGEQCLIPEK